LQLNHSDIMFKQTNLAHGREQPPNGLPLENLNAGVQLSGGSLPLITAWDDFLKVEKKTHATRQSMLRTVKRLLSYIEQQLDHQPSNISEEVAWKQLKKGSNDLPPSITTEICKSNGLSHINDFLKEVASSSKLNVINNSSHIRQFVGWLKLNGYCDYEANDVITPEYKQSVQLNPQSLKEWLKSKKPAQSTRDALKSYMEFIVSRENIQGELLGINKDLEHAMIVNAKKLAPLFVSSLAESSKGQKNTLEVTIDALQSFYTWAWEQGKTDYPPQFIRNLANQKGATATAPSGGSDYERRKPVTPSANLQDFIQFRNQALESLVRDYGMSFSEAKRLRVRNVDHDGSISVQSDVDEKTDRKHQRASVRVLGDLETDTLRLLRVYNEKRVKFEALQKKGGGDFSPYFKATDGGSLTFDRVAGQEPTEKDKALERKRDKVITMLLQGGRSLEEIALLSLPVTFLENRGMVALSLRNEKVIICEGETTQDRDKRKKEAEKEKDAREDERKAVTSFGDTADFYSLVLEYYEGVKSHNLQSTGREFFVSIVDGGPLLADAI